MSCFKNNILMLKSTVINFMVYKWHYISCFRSYGEYQSLGIILNTKFRNNVKYYVLGIILSYKNFVKYQFDDFSIEIILHVLYKFLKFYIV